MNFATVALVGLTLGQPAGQPLSPGYHPMNTRNIAIPIEYKKDRKQIGQVLLYVARNGENTWYQEGAVTPDKDSFAYFAKDDGIYWFKMVIVDLKGNKDPADLTRDPPDLKMVIDTTPPQVRVTNARRIVNEKTSSEDVVVEWQVDDKFPNDAETKVHFRAADSPKTYWQEVTLPANSRSGVKFPCNHNGSITVKVTAVDVAGNRTEVAKDIPGPNQQAVSNSTPSAPSNPVVPPVTRIGATEMNPTPIAPPNLDPAIPTGPAPVAPMGPGPVPPAPTAPLTPPPPAPAQNPPAPPPSQTLPLTPSVPEQPTTGNTTSGANTSMKPLATVDPNAKPAPAPMMTQGDTTPAAWNSSQPTVEVTRAQVINYPRFDLGFDLEQRGPSGISRVDLWVTRDEGKTWQKWSQHDGKNGQVQVALNVRENFQLEGNYGFRLVPVSGAGLSEREPVSGDVPEMRVILDVTAPQVELYPPVSDPNAPDTLILQWKAADRNFSDEPITLEWSASPTGPWKPVAMTGNEPVIQATATAAPVAKRLANTGQYGWRVPVGVPARVYLKATARDAAGNVKEVVTREPILVDLTKPKAKINGIVPGNQPRP